MPAPDEKILVRSVNWLGDAIMTTPALIRLREAHPKAKITVFSPEKLADLWQNQNFIDRVIAFSPSQKVWKTSQSLRNRGFETAIAFPNSIRSALELWLARIPNRIGTGRGLLLNRSIERRSGAIPMHKRTVSEVNERIRVGTLPEPIPTSAHHVHHYLHLVSALGASTEPLAPRIDVSAEEVEEVRAKFNLDTSTLQPWFGLNAGAEYGPAKRWPLERFVETAIALRKVTHCRWIVFGGQSERESAEKIAREIGEPTLNLSGKTSLRELAATMKLCDLVLTNDTGPMHLASAVGSRVVAIFGSTSPELTGPIFSQNARIIRQPTPCAPCFLRECPVDLRCLREISPETVVSACLDSLK
ncbi:MAG TPA: lipopolysaccharide heptosyltransferase II [Verrucomicrobiae bacterium]|jgi:heptosyltransferase-2